LLSMTDAIDRQGRPRDRILGTARSLFRQCGIRGAGVDAIAETAGTNKMTLYRHFHSKDDLIVACLKEASADADRGWAEVEASHPGDARAQLDAWVRVVDRTIHDGMCCEVANAAVELPEASAMVRATIAEFKTAQRDRLARLCGAAGIRRPDALADMLCLLLEGARVSRQAVGAGGPNRNFVDCADAAVALFAAEGGRGDG
jgi:AcrR family transcriptional regulator